MSYLLESLGRGLITRLRDVFESQLLVSESRQILADRAEQCPTSLDAHTQLGCAALADDAFGAAQGAFRRAAEIDPQAKLPQIGLACVEDELGNLGGALQHARSVADSDPSDPAAAFAVALCHERQRDVCSASNWYEIALERCHTLRNAHERLAAIAIRRGNWDAARACYEALHELDPTDLDVMLLRGGLELHAGAFEAAIETFQNALLIEPELNDETLVEPMPAGDDTALWQATQRAEKLVAQFPGASEFRVQLGDLYAQQGEDERAIHQYEVALDLQPMFLEATVKLGTQHMRCERFLEAARSFNVAGGLNDRLLVAFVGLGLAQQGSGEELEAEATFDLASSLAPNSTLLFAEATRLRYRANDVEGDAASLLEDACQQLEHQRRQMPQDAGVHYRLAMLRRHQGDGPAAARHFKTAVQLHPTDTKSVVQHALMQRQRDERLAQTLLEQTMKLPQQQIATHYDLGLLFAQPLQFELALDRLRQDGGKSARVAEESIVQSLQNIGLIDRTISTWRYLDEMVGAATPHGARSSL